MAVQGPAGVVTDLESLEAGQELAVAVGEEVVVDRVLRSEVRVERLGLHVHGPCQCPQRERVDAVGPHHLPGGIEDLPLGRLMASVPAVSTRFRRRSSWPRLDLSRTLRDTPDTVRKTEVASWKRQTAEKTIDAAPGAQGSMGLAETEFARMVEHLRTLSAEDWRKPTVCELWDVRTMASHVLGMAEAQASMRQFAHDFRAASKRSGGKMIDAMTATQVAERTSMTPEAIITAWRLIAPKAVKARRRTPALSATPSA